MPEAIKRISVQFMKEPEHVKIAAKELTTDLVDQYYIRVKKRAKSLILWLDWWMSSNRSLPSSLVGLNAGSMNWLVAKIRGFPSRRIHGDLDQNKRLRVLRDFKNGNLDVLVATDVAARGLIFQVWPMSTTTIFHKIQKAMFTGSDGQVVLGKQGNPLPLFRQMKWAIC